MKVDKESCKSIAALEALELPFPVADQRSHNLGRSSFWACRSYAIISRFSTGRTSRPLVTFKKVEKALYGVESGGNGQTYRLEAGFGSEFVEANRWVH